MERSNDDRFNLIQFYSIPFYPSIEKSNVYLKECKQSEDLERV